MRLYKVFYSFANACFVGFKHLLSSVLWINGAISNRTGLSEGTDNIYYGETQS